MRWTALLLTLVLPLAIAACDGGDDDGDATATPGATAAETPAATEPSGEQPGAEGFRAFAAQIAQAVIDQDIEFFRDRAQPEHIVCTETDLTPEIGSPPCASVGQELDVLQVGRWRSEGAPVEIDAALVLLQDVLRDALPSEMDDFGSGAARVHALNVTEDANAAVLTAIMERPEDFAGDGPLRVAVGTGWTFDGEHWRLISLLDAPVLAEDLLLPSEEGRGLYPGWESYEP